MPEMKKGSPKNPAPISEAPIVVLNAFGSLHKATFMPEAAPRSSSVTNPIIIDCANGVAMFIRNARVVYTALAKM